MLLDGRGFAAQVGRFVGDPQVLGLSVTSATVNLAARKCYRLWSTVDCFFKFGQAGVSATTSSHPLKAGMDVVLATDQTNSVLAGIVAAGTGALFVSEIDIRGF